MRPTRRAVAFAFCVLILASSTGVSQADMEAPNHRAAEMGAAIVAPGIPLAVVIENDIAYREGLHFNADEAYVRNLYEHLELTTRSREAGALFTPAEAAEERIRTEDLPWDAEIVEARLASLGLGDAVGALYVDHEAGGKVTVALTRDVEAARADLADWVGYPERLVVRGAPVTEAQLNAALDNIDYAPIVALTGDVHLAAVDAPNGRLVMAVDDPASANAANAGSSTGVPVFFTTGSSADEDAADQNNDPNVPPYRGSHGILLYADALRTTTGGTCTLGFAAKNRNGNSGALTAGHCLGPSYNRTYVFHNDSAPKQIGSVSGGYYYDGGATDYYAYSATTGNTTSATVFWYWPNTKKVRATDAGHEKVGYNRRKNGRVTREGSGLLASTNVDIDGSGTKYSGGWRIARYLHAKGDSGMNVWHHLNGYAYASGIHRGGATLDGVNYGVYSHISYALQASGYTLKTTT